MLGGPGPSLLSSDSVSVSGLGLGAGTRADTGGQEEARHTGTEPGTGYNVKMARDLEEVKQWWRQQLLERGDDSD